MFNLDAFSDGQVSSKLWLIETLERVLQSQEALGPWTFRVYGSWQGVLPFMLLTRGGLKIKAFELYDIDPIAQKTAEKVLDYWIYRRLLPISIRMEDCNYARWDSLGEQILINTSCEHIAGKVWFDSIPAGVLYCLQSTDMPHPTHINRPSSLEDWKHSLGIADAVFYEGTKFTDYGTFAFNRWMLIGQKL